MSIINKIKDKGLSGCLYSARLRLLKICNWCIFKWYSRLSIDEYSIVLESEGDCCDNAYALFDYMKNNGYLSKYHITWLVDHPEYFRNENNINYVQKNIGVILLPDTIKALATCHWYIYDHCNMMSQLKKRDGQILIYLSHGWGYKAPKGGKDNWKSDYDFMIATGELSAKGLSEYWNRELKDTIITGYPRLDYLFEENNNAKRIIDSNWNINKYKKVFLWMPTFRKSNIKVLSEDYIDNETGLPLFNTISSIEEFDNRLKELNILLLFKIHHLQAELPVFRKKFSNIIVINDNELRSLGLQLYQIVRFADCLISDYSSVSIDFLLMNRPIIYILDDYEKYSKSRGLFPDNAIDFMPGYHIFNLEELNNAIIEVRNGMDLYQQERNHTINNYHKYKDGNSSKRVLDYFEIR